MLAKCVFHLTCLNAKTFGFNVIAIRRNHSRKCFNNTCTTSVLDFRGKQIWQERSLIGFVIGNKRSAFLPFIAGIKEFENRAKNLLLFQEFFCENLRLLLVCVARAESWCANSFKFSSGDVCVVCIEHCVIRSCLLCKKTRSSSLAMLLPLLCWLWRRLNL